MSSNAIELPSVLWKSAFSDSSKPWLEHGNPQPAARISHELVQLSGGITRSPSK